MLPSSRIPAAVPSPPLSASPNGGASDTELDTNKHRGRGVRRQSRRRDSSPCSSTSRLSHTHAHARAHTVSATSSFAEDISQDKRQWETGPRRIDQTGSDRSSVDKAFSLVERSSQGQPLTAVTSPDWHVLKLPLPLYRILRERLENARLLDYFDRSIRHDYDPQRGRLVLRMVESPLHGTLQDEVSFEIRHQLRLLADKRPGDIVADLASGLRSRSHAQLLLPNNSIEEVLAEKSPDHQLFYRAEKYPSFVMEVAVSQKSKNLEFLPQDYYEGSGGEIKTVLTIDVDSANPEKRATTTAPKEARFSLYRGPERIQTNMVFRHKDGRPGDCSLQFLLSDFIPDEVLSGLSQQQESRIRETIVVDFTAEKLCRSLSLAEEAQASADVRVPLKKRTRQVHWDRVYSLSSDNEDKTDEDVDGDIESVSKRRRTSDDRLYHGRHSRDSRKDIPVTRTRSISRSEAEAGPRDNAVPSRRTRSMSRHQAEAGDVP